MHEEIEMTPAQRELEGTLGSLIPLTTRIMPVAAALAAGRKSAMRRVHLWQSVIAMMMMVAAGSWLMPGGGPAGGRGQIVQPVVVIDQPVHRYVAAPIEPLPPQCVLRLERDMQLGGVDAMPATNLPSVKTMHARDVF